MVNRTTARADLTAGAALLIAGSQIPNFYGVDIPRGTPFFDILKLFVLHLNNINSYVASVAGVTLLSGILVKNSCPNFPI